MAVSKDGHYSGQPFGKDLIEEINTLRVVILSSQSEILKFSRFFEFR